MISRPSDRGAGPILCLVIDGHERAATAAASVEAAVRGGVDWVQIRDRSLDAASLLQVSREIHAAALRGAEMRRVRVIVNRRLDIALSLGTNAVHLGFDATSPDTARRLLGPDAWIGISAHDAEEVGEAARAGAHYVHLAAIFEPLSKRATRRALGVSELGKAVGRGIPVLAQGGVEATNCADLIRAGAAGVAVTGAIALARNPRAAAHTLRVALDSVLRTTR